MFSRRKRTPALSPQQEQVADDLAHRSRKALEDNAMAQRNLEGVIADLLRERDERRSTPPRRRGAPA